MSVIPDELWHQILSTGIQTLTLTHRDLCSVSIVGDRRLRLISGEPSLWSSLLSRDFPSLPPSDLHPKSLYKTRRSSVALNIWQPEVVRGRQKQIVEQCTVPIDFRLSALSMEVQVCKQQITIYNRAYNDQQKKLKEGKEMLKSARYHPLQHYQSAVIANDCRMKRKR